MKILNLRAVAHGPVPKSPNRIAARLRTFLATKARAPVQGLVMIAHQVSYPAPASNRPTEGRRLPHG